MISLTLVILCTTCIIIPISLSHELTRYESVIKNTHDKSRSVGVVVALARNHLSFEKTTMWHELTRTLSNKGISTIIIDFQQLESQLTFYIGKTYSPLIVIDIDTIEDLRKVEMITETANMNYFGWLIFFNGEVDPDVCRYCHEPPGNLFHLNFASKFLISCCDSNILQEWWSTRKTQTKRQNSARLTNEKSGIVWLSPKLFNIVDRSMDGEVFRITSLLDLRSTKKEGDNFMAIAAIIKKLSQSMNFTLGKILWEKAYGLRYKGMSNWTGIIGRIQRKEADLILSPLIMSSERYDYLQFTSPILYGVYQLHVRKLDTAQLSWNAYFKVFAADVWIVIIGLILTVPIILTFMERHTKKSSFLVLLSKHYTFVWGVFCQQGLSDFPDELPLRITYISLITSSLIVSATYGASFMSTLAVSSSFAPFSSVEEFLRDGRYKLIVTRNSTFYYEFKNSNLTFMKQMMSLMKPVNLLPINYENGFEQICTERVAFYTHEVAKKGLVNNFSCEIASIKAGNMETLALGMPRNNPYYEPINHFVQNMALKGIFQELLTEHSTTPSLENGFESVYLQRITPLIVVWLIGLGIALIIFIFEKNLDVSIKEARDKNRGVKNNRK